ncbi:MAG: hypothetical protein U1D55_01760 [Phycisphaerae bacterium]
MPTRAQPKSKEIHAASIQSEIVVLLLLAPSETSSSLMNLEFENPRQSQL